MDNSVNGIDLAKLGLNLPTNTKKEESLGQADFLKLMTEQLRNQNPLEPQENGDFMAQMAQFSTVDGVQELSKAFSELSSMLQSNQALQATALVGRSVEIAGNTAQLASGGNIKGAVELDTSVPELSFSIKNSQGEIVKKFDLGAQAAGKVHFTWDGLDDAGKSSPAGNYTVEAYARIDGKQQQLSTLVSANVNSVTIGKNNSDITLSLAGIGDVSINSIKQIY